MGLTVGVIMDPIESINIKKDSTFAMLLEAQRRGYAIEYIEPSGLWIEAGAGSCEAGVRSSSRRVAESDAS